MRLDQVVEEHAGEPAGDRGRDQEEPEPAHPPRVRSAERARRDRPELGAEVGDERGQGAQVHHGVKGETLIRPAEKVRHQDQMAGGGDGEELGHALDHAEHDALRVRHPTISSPPSTPMTLPVIQ